jgi:hypothetical protein
METYAEALRAVRDAWPTVVRDCRAVLGSELHYQAMIYHALRVAGRVPLGQLGMNVKQWIPDPHTALFRSLDRRKHVKYRGGFEPIPDIVIFQAAIGGDWRRRNWDKTLVNMLATIEVKASERDKSRLARKEVASDVEKLAAHREEVRFRGADMLPIMLVIDTAPDLAERMSEWSLQASLEAARRMEVAFLYLSQVAQIVEVPPSWDGRW